MPTAKETEALVQAAVPPASPRRVLSSSNNSNNHQHSSSNLSSTEKTTSDEDMVLSEEQLSHDLAQFLSNPSLKAALADGSLDLASYSNTLQTELDRLEVDCIAAYRSKTTEMAQLCQELDHCDGILLGLQELLLGFQADLGGLSGDIRDLQDTSKRLGIQLRNRKGAAVGLRDFLGRIVLSPSLVQTIGGTSKNTTEGVVVVNRQFLSSIQELKQLYRDTHDTTPRDWACGKAPSETVAGEEMKAHVEQLQLVAIGRIRDYFLHQMSLLRKPQTNIRILQSHGLLPNTELYVFLMDASPEIAQELFGVYADSMSKTLYALFRTYHAQLMQLDATHAAATKQDVLAVEDAYLRDSITTKAKKRVDVFSLGSRANDVLASGSPAAATMHEHPLVAHMAIREQQTFPYERLFKSCLQHLVDAVTNEHVVCRQFFQRRDAFEHLFPNTLQLLLEQLENYVHGGCYDGLCILLMIKITHQFQRAAHARTITDLDGFFEKVTDLLWPRLKLILELHTKSLKNATPVSLGGVDLHAHYVSRRFGEFICSLLLILQKGNKTTDGSTSPTKTPPSRASKRAPRPAFAAADPIQPSPSPTSGLSTKPGQSDSLLQDINGIVDEYVALLERLSEEHAVNIKGIVFKINNLDQVICIFQERRVAGGKELNRMLELLMLQRELFVEEELLHGFSKMIAFIQQTEASLQAGNVTDQSINIQVVESLVREFASNWRGGMEEINRNVLSYFSNFRNGMEILKQVLTQLLLYYTRFQDVIRKVFKKQQPAFTKDLVPTTIILGEIKKYALVI